METIPWLLCLVAFIAGFVDSMVGGGGLIQTPLSLVLLPQYSVASIIGTLKIPAFCGTALAARQYLKQVTINWKLFFLLAAVALVSAGLGSYSLTHISNDFVKPFLFVILILLAIYTLIKKDFGQAQGKAIPKRKLLLLGCITSMIVGFYDGFIGPATGTFFILGFVTLLKMDFIRANTYAKMVNLATNAGSMLFFIFKGMILWQVALPMAVCNALGGYLGAKTALKNGNRLIRYVFMGVIWLSILRFGYEVLLG